MSEQFEHKVHDLLGDIEFEPGSDVWKRVQQQIRPEKKRRRFIFWWLLPVVLAGGALTYYFTTENNKQQSIAKNTTSKTISDKIETIPLQSSSSEVKEKTIATQTFNNDARKKQKTILTSTPVYISAKNNQLKQQQKHSANKSRSSFNPPSVNANTSIPDNDRTSQTAAVTKTIKDSETASIAKQTIDQNKEESKQPNDNTNDTAVVKKQEKKKSKKWRFGITADAGVSNVVAVQNNNYAPVFNSGASGSPLTSGSFGPLKQRQQTFAGAQMGIGVIVHRTINKHIDLSAAVSYRYQSFAVKDIIYKDSANLQVVNYSSTADHSLHNLQFSLGTNWYLLSRKKARFGITTAIDNMYLLSAHENISTVNAGNASFQKNNLSNNKWQPYLRIGLTGSFTTNQHQLIQLSPYFGYGLRSFSNTNNTSQHVWQLGVKANWYFK